jgi:hypothetical protein
MNSDRLLAIVTFMSIVDDGDMIRNRIWYGEFKGECSGDVVVY